MTQNQLENMVLDLQRQVKALASRPYTQRAEKAEAEALKVDAKVENVSDEVVANAATFADFLEEYYLSQFEE